MGMSSWGGGDAHDPSYVCCADLESAALLCMENARYSHDSDTTPRFMHLCMHRRAVMRLLLPFLLAVGRQEAGQIQAVGRASGKELMNLGETANCLSCVITTCFRDRVRLHHPL